MNQADGGFQPRWFVVALIAAVIAGIATAVWLYGVVAGG